MLGRLSPVVGGSGVRPTETAGGASGERGAHAILVPAAHSTAGIGIIRSLGAAGYRVHAAAATEKALGLKSRYAAHGVVHPPLGSAEFDRWLGDYVGENAIEMITPGGFDEMAFRGYSKLFTTSADPEVAAATRSKYALFDRLLRGDETQRAHLPPSLLVDFDRGLPAPGGLAALGAPLFVKLDRSEARATAPSDVIKLADAAEARSVLERLGSRYRAALIQAFVPGQGAGAFLLRWNGHVIARMMHLRLHEMPHTGGASSLRVSWWHDAMMRDAEVKLAALDWQGVAMVEYRWDPTTDAFYLMEMNLRFWGSLHLALYAGVDFPRLLADAFFGRVPDRIVEGRRGVVCRNTIPFELGYLLSLWRDPKVPRGRKLYSLWEAVRLSLDPRVYNDMLFPGDRMLYFRRLPDLLPRQGSRGHE
jgi:hypothetical protein